MKKKSSINLRRIHCTLPSCRKLQQKNTQQYKYHTFKAYEYRLLNDITFRYTMYTMGCPFWLGESQAYTKRETFAYSLWTNFSKQWMEGQKIGNQSKAKAPLYLSLISPTKELAQRPECYGSCLLRMSTKRTCMDGWGRWGGGGVEQGNSSRRLSAHSQVFQAQFSLSKKRLIVV